MDKELAEKITRIQIESQRLFYEKMDILKAINSPSWEEAQTQAMKFMMGIK